MSTIDLGKLIENLTILRGMVIMDKPMPLYLPVQEYQLLKDRIDFVCSAMEALGVPVLLKKARKLRQIIFTQAEESDSRKIPKEMLDQFPVSRVWMLFRYAVQNSWRSLAIDLKKGFPEELSSRVVMILPTDKTTYFLHTEEVFSGTVQNSLPSSVYDMDEACRCFALGRSTSCVFHLMRIMERCVQKMGSSLGVPETIIHNKEWQHILNQTKGKIKELYPVERDQTRIKYEAMVSHLESVKIAWRNPTMHPKATYTDEEAKNIVAAVGAFVQDFSLSFPE